MNAAYEKGDDRRPLKGKHKGLTSYTDKFEEQYPCTIRKLFRYAQNTIGNQASYQDLARVMNSKAKGMASMPQTKFNSMNVWCWFRQQGGKEKSPKEKPFLTPDQKKAHKFWCEEEKARMANLGKDFYACLLDEKWFYVTFWRRKLKILPTGEGEDSKEVAPHIRTTLSRHFPTKAMFLGVVANPVPSKNFDEKIFLSGCRGRRSTHRSLTLKILVTTLS